MIAVQSAIIRSAVVNLEKYWETSYEIDAMNEIVDELKEAYDDSYN